MLTFKWVNELWITVYSFCGNEANNETESSIGVIYLCDDCLHNETIGTPLGEIIAEPDEEQYEKMMEAYYDGQYFCDGRR